MYNLQHLITGECPNIALKGDIYRNNIYYSKLLYFRSIDQNHRVISLGLNRFAIRILGKISQLCFSKLTLDDFLNKCAHIFIM